MKQFLVWLLSLFAIIPLQSFSPQVPGGALQHDLDTLTKRGFTYRMLDNDLIELTDPLGGEKQFKTLREPSETQLRSWAAQRGVPILEIDPTHVDTSRYAGWYTYWAEVPLSNGLGDPLIVGDFDQNGSTEVYGVFKPLSSSNYESQAYEVDSLGLPTLVHAYTPYVGISRFVSDVDSDSLREITFFYGGVFTNFEQVNTSVLPVRFNLQHDSWQGDLDPGPSKALIGFFDQDSLVDFLYKGSEPDSTNPTVGIGKEYVAEFNPDSNNFVRVWSTQFVSGQQSTTAGFAVEDFDRDGKMDFAVTEGLRGRVFFAENEGDNSYATVWQDSTPYVNLYYQTSGDVDGDAWPEFFVAATMSNGTWVLVYEAVGNNTYSLRFLFHLLAGGVLDTPTLLTSDIEGNGKKELVVLSGAYLFVFKSNNNDTYLLWYMKREGTKDAVQTYDFNHDGKQDFIVSKLVVDSLNRARFKADVYLASGIVSVHTDYILPAVVQLKANYPNPFNPSTTIQYDLPVDAHVTLKIYDVLGRAVMTVVDQYVVAGHQQVVLDASGLASGMYFYRLQAGTFVATRKLLLLK